MIKIITRLVFTLLALIFSFSSSIAQTNNIIDSFGDHNLPGWYWGGNLNMKYSHSYDNLENGYAEILSSGIVEPGSYVGLIRKMHTFQVVQDNIFSVMLQGTGTDLNVIVQILFDRDNNGKFDENEDAWLESKPLSLNFSGWKEIHLNLTEKEFKVHSRIPGEDFSILENEAFGIQLSYQAGKQYKSAKLETGIALLAERPNKEVKQETTAYGNESEESYFNLRNYPNPFNPETNITYTLKYSGNVKITVYDRLGREVIVLVDEAQNEGEHSVVFNGSNLPSGIYFYRLKTSEATEVKKMVLTK